MAETQNFASQLENSSIAHAVPKTEITANGDYNLSGERYKITIDNESIFEWKEIGEIVDLIKDGDWIESKDQSESGIRLIQTGNVGIGEFKDKDEKARYINEETFKRLNCTEIFPDDILVSRLPDPVGRACLVPYLNTKMITAVDCSIIRFNQKKILPSLFVYYTKLDKYYEYVAPYLTGSSRSRISRKNLEKVKIPLPPLSIQEEIVADIEGYQKIIDGAKAVVANYKPRIDIDADWEMVELGEVCEITSSRRIFKEEYVDEGVPFYRTKEIVELAKGLTPSLELFISQERYLEIKGKNDIPKPGDILVSAVGTLGVSWIVNHNSPFYFKDGNLVWIKDIKRRFAISLLKIGFGCFYSKSNSCAICWCSLSSTNYCEIETIGDTNS